MNEKDLFDGLKPLTQIYKLCESTRGNAKPFMAAQTQCEEKKIFLQI